MFKSIVAFILVSLFLCSCVAPKVNVDIKPAAITPSSPTIVAPQGLALTTIAGHVFFDLNSQVSLVPSITAGNQLTYSISPALPLGLSLNSSTGEISGQAQANVQAVDFTLTATNSEGSSDTDFTLHIYPAWVVNSAGDSADDDAGNNLNCLATADSGCTLRAAIQTVNFHAGKQIIFLDESPVITAALPSITDDVIIVGRDEKMISSNSVHGGYRLFNHSTAARSLDLYNLEIVDFGGAINGGAIQINAANTFKAESVIFRNNRASTGGALYFRSGSVGSINHTQFINNTSTGNSGAVDAENAGTNITITNSYGKGNSGNFGGFAHICTGAYLKLLNSTLEGNTSSNGVLAVCIGTFEIRNSTIANNISTGAGTAGIYLNNNQSFLTISNTVFADNLRNNGTGSDHGCAQSSSNITTEGGNIFKGASVGSCGALFISATDKLNTDPLLDSIAALNGGLVPSLMPLTGSPAIEGGDNSSCLLTDFRGTTRPFDYDEDLTATCDSGAIEKTLDD